MELSLNLGVPVFSSCDPVEARTADGVPGGNGDFDYLRDLEEEMKKIEPFRRELPLCMMLLESMVKRFRKGVRCETAEDEQEVAPSIEWLLPLKRKAGDEESRIEKKRAFSLDDGGQLKEGLDRDEVCEKPVNLDRTSDSAAVNGNGFLQLPKKSGSEQQSYLRQDNGSLFSLTSPTSVLANQAASNCKGGGSSKLIFGSSFVADQMKLQKKTQQQNTMQQQQQSQGMFKKQRRSWSPELHRRFLQALEKLGGAQAATPKQIREMMKVQDLTNDEVKSHLQKYRLNIRRLPSPSEDPNSPRVNLGKSNVQGGEEEEEEEYR
ncbi:hypothetical protein MLD38_031472 [Melastoma candidum]|uniref:Uncharacterized protein n=1 Tax=Melastoma candidum TaxID=119954 RepID=A0ACB9MPT0_9MYRT|nr:hypothetical protein MLD38_031472 [Melastoma candidum]